MSCVTELAKNNIVSSDYREVYKNITTLVKGPKKDSIALNDEFTGMLNSIANEWEVLGCKTQVLDNLNKTIGGLKSDYHNDELRTLEEKLEKVRLTFWEKVYCSINEYSAKRKGMSSDVGIEDVLINDSIKTTMYRSSYRKIEFDDLKDITNDAEQYLNDLKKLDELSTGYKILIDIIKKDELKESNLHSLTDAVKNSYLYEKTCIMRDLDNALIKLSKQKVKEDGKKPDKTKNEIFFELSKNWPEDFPLKSKAERMDLLHRYKAKNKAELLEILNKKSLEDSIGLNQRAEFNVLNDITKYLRVFCSENEKCTNESARDLLSLCYGKIFARTKCTESVKYYGLGNPESLNSYLVKKGMLEYYRKEQVNLAVVMKDILKERLRFLSDEDKDILTWETEINNRIEKKYSEFLDKSDYKNAALIAAIMGDDESFNALIINMVDNIEGIELKQTKIKLYEDLQAMLDCTSMPLMSFKECLLISELPVHKIINQIKSDDSLNWKYECKKCGLEHLSEYNTKCTSCGAKKEDIITYECPTCGAHADSAIKKCTECGEEFDNKTKPVLVEPFKPKDDKKDTAECYMCGSTVSMSAPKCPICGAEFE